MISTMLLNVMWLLGLGNMVFTALAQSRKCEEQQGGYFGRMGITLNLYSNPQSR